jgi:uncharacterized protein (TIRG00374 family)
MESGRTEVQVMTSKFSKLALRVLIGVGLLVLIAQFVDIGESLRAIRGLDAGWLAASVACYGSTRVLMALKWWVLLGGRASSISYSTVQRALCLSDYYSLLFPNTLAVDVTRVVLLRHHRGAGFMTAAILADRVINVATTAGISLLAVGVTYALHGAWPFAPAVAHGVIAIALSVIVAAFAAASDRATALAVRVLRAGARAFPRLTRLPRWIDAAAQVHAAMSTMLTGRGTLLPAIALAVGTVIARVGTIFFLFIAIGAPQPFALTLMLSPIVTLIALLPISLFGLGVKDSAFVFFFGSAGVPASLALAVSLTSYGVVIAASLLLGLIASVVGPALPVESALKPAPERNSP